MIVMVAPIRARATPAGMLTVTKFPLIADYS